jgi:deazaflavin-dependent oxidoreductase (nitroreductase family)
MAVGSAVRDVFFRGMNLGHNVLVTVSGGRVLSQAFGMPVYRVTTTGRVSGAPRTVLLTSPVVDGDDLIFVASKGGDSRHPDWYRNLQATPEITVEPLAGGPAVTMTTHTISDDEKATLWPQIVAAYRSYDSYQSRTDRNIPVVRATLKR